VCAQDEEVGLLTEVTHLQEIMESLCLQADSPATLPPASEQVIADLKGDAAAFTFQVHYHIQGPYSLSLVTSRIQSVLDLRL